MTPPLPVRPLVWLIRQYQRFEKGEQKPGFDNLRNIADFYGVSVDWLMGRTERREICP